MSKDPSDQRPAGGFDRLIRFLQYEERFGVLNCTQCAEVSTLEMHLSKLSSGAHQWTSTIISLPDFSEPRYSTRWLIIGYSNPDESRFLNHLCYCFPILIERTCGEGDDRLLACLGPYSSIPLSDGIYWDEDDKPVLDPDEDWKRFFGQLGRGLWLAREEETQADLQQQLERGQVDELTVEGLTWKDSVTALVYEWANSPERVHQEIMRLRF